MKINEFIKSLKELNIDISKEQLDKLEQYYQIVIEKNKIETLCDIGSGAGFPGIVIKILFPKIKITLIDSLNKRILFLNDVIEKLKLKEIEAICIRAEDYARENEEKYDLVTARAVASLNILLECSIKLVKKNKYFVAMKGTNKEEVNIKKIENELKIIKEKEIVFFLPNENSARRLIKFKKIEKTPKKYPRIYSEIKSKPL